MWNKIFTAFSAAPGGAVDMLEADTRKMIKRYNVLVSADLRDLLLRGFPCTCANTPTSPPTNPDNRVKQVSSRLEMLQLPLTLNDSLNNVWCVFFLKLTLLLQI